MNELNQNTRKNRRRSDRVEAPDLFVSVKQKRWLVFEEYIDVETMDVNRGGVGIIASDLNLNLLENVRLHFDYDAEEYFISGVVVYQHERDGLEFYGVMFTQLPPQFENLLGRLLAQYSFDTNEPNEEETGKFEKTQQIDFADVIKSRQMLRAKQIGLDAVEKARNATRQVKDIAESNRKKIDAVASEIIQSTTIPDSQRRVEARYQSDLLGIRARSRGLASFVDFIDTEALDISMGGVSFSTRSTDPRLGEKVRLELKYKNMVLRASGLITYFGVKDNRNQYGVQFTMVPTKLKSLIKIVEENSQKSKQAIAK